MKIIEVKDITKAYGSHQVLKGVDITVDEPMILALVGPNGSGKSILLNLMMNPLAPDQGSIQILGLNPSDTSMFRRVSFLKDNTVLYPYLSGDDHLQYASKTYGLPAERVSEVTELLGITNYMAKKTGSYSLGMKQHLLLALAILNDPEVLILDEPLTGLDPTSIIFVRELLAKLHQEGKTILLSSHTLSEVDELTSEIAFLVDGRIQRETITQGRSEDRYTEIYRGTK